MTFSPRRDMQVPMDRYSVRDLWQHRDLGAYDIPFTAEVQSHEARVFRIRQLSTSANGRSVSDGGGAEPHMNAWLLYALITMLLWGVWGAFAGLPSEHGVPETLNYVVWSLTMIPPALFVLRRSGQPLMRDRRSIALGLAIGLLGAGGQLVLFHAVRIGPPYLIFPIISLSPALTIALSFALLKERTGMLGMLGIVLALLSLPLFDYRADGEPSGYGAVVPVRAADPRRLGRAGVFHQACERDAWMPRASSST